MKKASDEILDEQNITIKDIARMAGVSIGTVSRAINENGYVGIETRKKVMKIIADNDFKPNAAARSMIKKKSSIVGIIVPEINNPFLAELVIAIEEILSRENLSVLLCNSKYKYEKELNFIDDLINRNAEGLIFIASELMDESAISKLKRNLKVVSVGCKFGDFDCVNLTEWQSAYEMTEYLISLGHKRIACVGFNPTSKQTMERLRGYVDALEKHGLEVVKEYMLSSEGTANTGYTRTTQLLELKKPPTAIFAINDFYAINAYLAVADKGLRVGQDISISGFDDISVSRLVNPALTTVRCSTSTMAELATDLILKRIRNDLNGKSKEILLPAEIVKRDSTKPYKNRH